MSLMNIPYVFNLCSKCFGRLSDNQKIRQRNEITTCRGNRNSGDNVYNSRKACVHVDLLINLVNLPPK